MIPMPKKMSKIEYSVPFLVRALSQLPKEFSRRQYEEVRYIEEMEAKFPDISTLRECNLITKVREEESGYIEDFISRFGDENAPCLSNETKEEYEITRFEKTNFTNYKGDILYRCYFEVKKSPRYIYSANWNEVQKILDRSYSTASALISNCKEAYSMIEKKDN